MTSKLFYNLNLISKIIEFLQPKTIKKMFVNGQQIDEVKFYIT